MLENLARLKEYVAPDGTRWRRRGNLTLTGKQLAKRLGRREVMVVHHYLDSVAMVEADQRRDFWAEAEARMRESPHAHFAGFEFRNDAGAFLLVVEERC